MIHHQQFPFWKREIQWENGFGGSGGYERIFWNPNARISSKKIKKNPFVSARSVLPSYPKTIMREV
jgi:hypothetical protein